jgi:hypothetical protein
MRRAQEGCGQIRRAMVPCCGVKVSEGERKCGERGAMFLLVAGSPQVSLRVTSYGKNIRGWAGAAHG